MQRATPSSSRVTRPLATAVLIGSLCSCATPSDVRKSPTNEVILRPTKLEAVALCVTRGFDEQMYTVNNLRTDLANGMAEMIALGPGSSTAIYVVDFLAVPEGTSVHYYINPGNMFQGTLAKSIRAIINAC